MSNYTEINRALARYGISPVTTSEVDQGTMSGDLGPIIQEAFGHAEDCGRTYNAVPHVLGYIERTYDTGLYGFVMDVKPLW